MGWISHTVNALSNFVSINYKKLFFICCFLVCLKFLRIRGRESAKCLGAFVWFLSGQILFFRLVIYALSEVVEDYHPSVIVSRSCFTNI